MVGIWVAAAGAAMLAYVGWCWAGRSARARRWARRAGRDLLVLGVFPGLGLVLLASGIAAMLPEPIIGWAAPLILAGFALFAMGLVYLVARPRWWGPRWYRRMPAAERRSDLTHPLTAAGAAAGTAGGTSTARSRTAATRAVADRFGTGARPIARFTGGYVQDPDSDATAHAMARKGTVAGELAIFPQGLAFAATPVEDSLRDEVTFVVLKRDQLTAVEVVPARAGADGRRRPGFWRRSPFRRLVVRTAGGDYVFEVAYGRAATAAARLSGGTSD